MQSIFAKLLYEIEKRHDTVLVTIIRESGSTPRGEGAQMLVGAQGPLSGTIAVSYTHLTLPTILRV